MLASAILTVHRKKNNVTEVSEIFTKHISYFRKVRVLEKLDLKVFGHIGPTKSIEKDQKAPKDLSV